MQGQLETTRDRQPALDERVTAGWDGSHIGRFRVDGVLGRGGMGVVLRAFDPQLQRPVAIKLLTERSARINDGTTVDLRHGFDHDGLLAEARALAQITDPNVLAVHEIGNECGQTFLVMELVDGVDLRRWLAAAPRSLGAIYAVFEQASRGLIAAHHHNIIHRDFKPENVLISADGRVRVCDFGVATLARSVELGRACTVGTPRYMAPELWCDRAASVQSDVYAFAVALVEAICDEPVTDPVVLERDLARHAVASRARSAIVRALDPDPQRRPTSTAELVRALAPRPHRRWLIPAAVLASAGAAGVVLALAVRGGSEADAADLGCTDSTELLAARWSELERAGVRAGVVGTGAPDAAAHSEAVVERLDRYARSWQRLRAETCSAAVPPARRPARLACLDRRLYELGSVARTLRQPPSIELALGRSNALADLGTCIEATEIRLPSGAAARAAVEDLTARMIAVYDAGLARPGTEGDQAALAAHREEAVSLNDFELALRIDRSRAQLLGNAGKVAAAGQVLDAAYELAARHRLDSIAAMVLVENAHLANVQGDAGGAESKLRVARSHLERSPDATPYSRVLLYRAISTNAVVRGNLGAAQEALDLAQQAVDQMEPRDPLWTAQLGLHRARLLDQQGKLAEGLEMARRAEAQLRALGTQGVPDLGETLRTIVNIQRQRGEHERALHTQRERLALLSARLSPDDAGRISAEADLGFGLLRAGKIDEAIASLEQTLAHAKRVPTLARFVGDYHGNLSRAYRMRGDLEPARVHAQSAIDEARTKLGARDQMVGFHEISFALLEMEAGDFDRAATHLRIAEDVLAILPADHVNRLDLADTQIELLLAQGKAEEADQLATRMLALFAERKIDDARNERFWLGAAAARTMRGAAREGLELASRARARRAARNADALELALAEVELEKARHAIDANPRALAALRRHEVMLRDPNTRFAHAQLVRWFEAKRYLAVSVK